MSRIAHPFAACTAVLCTGLAHGSAAASVTMFTSEAAFDAATSTSIVVSFEEPEWAVALGVSFFGSIASDGITFVPISSPPVSAPNLFIAPPRQTNFCCPLASQTLTSSGGEDIDLVFASPPRAVGFVCYANGGAPIVYTLTLAGGSEVTLVSAQPPNTTGFVGFTSALPIEKLNWVSDFGEIINTGMDDVRVGDAVCLADLNADGQVSGADLAILLGAWSSGGPADLDGSGTVNAADLAVLLGAWGACG
ncbi:MAG: hypothetical protein SGJ11_13945 [Phycisphaerae bacterium]|nr:hypothetical protein [Phycisphaerae bacterium]